ncbi:MAG: ABC transporter ATP-binding protein [Hydrogenophaga sp.]|nr:ABC transporter ATP-binding protein [Hydrogenophaga sp.]
MSSEVRVSVNALSKSYHIYAQPRDRLKQSIYTRLQRLAGRSVHQYYSEFWALRDVTLDVRKGETVGIIGRNGSGKSTLLQLICGTLNPSSGSVWTSGRIAALLELGSGFNPEFTGRENIYLNAAVLGLSKDEIDDRFDEIVFFADIGDFLDRPVKTYSSGMFARLAFAVAINVSPDVLIVDEALSVGDSGFQLKCMMKMRELQQRGLTILFVSHDTQSVIRFCDRAVVMNEGRVHFQSDDVQQCVKVYEKLTRYHQIAGGATPSGASPQDGTLTSQPADVSYAGELGSVQEERFGIGVARYVAIDMLSDLGESTNQFGPGETIQIVASVWSDQEFDGVAAGFSLRDKKGVDIAGDNNIYAGVSIRLRKGLTRIVFRVPLQLAPGEYFLFMGLATLDDKRIELDQRWPVRKMQIVSRRSVIGLSFCPAEIEVI